MEIRIRVYDAEGKLSACRIAVSKLEEEPGEGRSMPGIVDYCNGEYVFEADEGEYAIEAFRGKLYEPDRRTVSVSGESVDVRLELRPLADAAKLGMYAFDAHSHVSRDRKRDTGNLEWASTVMKGEDFRFFYAGSPYDHETHLEYMNDDYKSDRPYRERFASELERINRESADFILDIGNEFVKCRYGHLCLLNFEQKPPFSRYYDEAWDPWNDGNRQGEEPEYALAYPYEAVLAERRPHSFAFAAHPTSWWRGANGVFVSNVSATLAFDILAGTVDGMVVMGYGADRKPYQELWFEALKQGYFLPGVAETDASFDGVPEQRFIQLKTYAYLEEFSKEALGIAMLNGRNFVSSGPLLTMKVNGLLPGAVLSYGSGEVFNVETEAYGCYEGALSSMQLIVNGEVAAELACNGSKAVWSHKIAIEEDSFLIAKCYDAAGNVAITSPVYIRNRPFVNQDYLANFSVRVRKSGQSAKGNYWLDDETERIAFDGEVRLRMKPASSLHIFVDGEVRTVKPFELEELQAIFKRLYLGDFNLDNRYSPGEVPAADFGLAEVKDILDRAEMELEF